MTNGEKIKNIYPDLEIISEIKDVYVIILEGHNVWSPKLEVFKSWWNAEYKEPSNSGKPNKSEIPTGSTTDVPENNVGKIEPTKNNLGVDCISREQALMCLTGKFEIRGYEPSELVSIFSKRIKALPPVTPIRPKGHWIDHSDEGYVECPKCGSSTNCDENINELHFCFSCGAEMDGVEE